MASLPLRIFRSFRSNFYTDDILNGLVNYPDDYFPDLLANGFNAIWVRGLLRNMATTSVFPDLGTEIAQRQDALGALIARAAQHGVGVYLFLQEPHYLPTADPFWTAHPDVRGCESIEDYQEEPASAFCTSTPAVRAWMREAMTNLFRAVPELAGWISITASEAPAHCYSRIIDYLKGQRTTCPRCAERHPIAIVGDIINDMRDGTRAASASAQMIVWNWSWAFYEEDPQPTLLPRLPRDIILMLDWERGLQLTGPHGRPFLVDEYSLAHVGPSQRFTALYHEARQRGIPVMAKMQVGTTHELATVPNLPLVNNLYDKLVAAENLGLEGILATWNFGNTFSLNTAAVARFVQQPERQPTDDFVAALATDYFGLDNGTQVAAAIRQFAVAMAHFPFDLDLLYYWPGNYAPAYRLTLAPLEGTFTGWCCILQERGDDLSKTAVQFTIEEIIACLATLVPIWEQGVALYADALVTSASPQAILELGVAKAVGHVYRSTLKIYQTYVLRRDRPADMVAQYRLLLDDEIANLEALLPLVAADPRLGFHAECQGFMFTPELIREKLADLRAQREELT